MQDLKNRIIQALGENLVCLLLTGSRARGEGRKDSDYDLAIIVSKTDEQTLRKLRVVFMDLKGFSVYLLDKNDLKTLPKAMFLQFVYSHKLYGDFSYPLPSESDVASYVNVVRRDWLNRIRHYLVLPHPPEKPASVLLPALKYVYLCLSYLMFRQTGRLPLTREETITLLKGRKDYSLGISLMEILEDWDLCKETYLGDPLPLLLQIETFFRRLGV